MIPSQDWDTLRPKLKPRLLALFALAVVAFGCGDSSSGNSPTSGSTPTPSASTDGKKLKVGVVFDSGGRGDKSFNDSAYAGVERARKEFGTAIEVNTVDSKTENDFEENITGLADSGSNLVFCVGVTQATALGNVAPKYPDAKFAIIDAEVPGDNVRSLVFSEEQGSFLAGYLAGLVTKTGKVGFVGGKNIPLIKKFEAGYTAGARLANPAIDVLPAKYTESWDDTSTGKASATVLFDQGADIVYQAAGRAGLGVITAAVEKNKPGAKRYAIGVDSDQDDEAKGVVLTSMVKHVDESVYNTIKDALDGKFSNGTKRYDLSANGVGLTDFRNTKNDIGAANIAKVEAMAAKIKDGSLKIPEKIEDIEPFLASAKK
ncbi:BMP family ABC transporter substrate-binding protein [soil metagenome]